MEDADAAWDFISDALSEGHLVALLTPDVPLETSGLVDNHVYTVTGVATVNDGTTEYRLVQIYNVWKHDKTYSARFHDRDPIWDTGSPSLRD